MKLVNATANEIELPLEIPDGYKAESWQGVTSERLTDRNTMEEPNKIAIIAWPVPRGRTWRIPPYCASVVWFVEGR